MKTESRGRSGNYSSVSGKRLASLWTQELPASWPASPSGRASCQGLSETDRNRARRYCADAMSTLETRGNGEKHGRRRAHIHTRAKKKKKRRAPSDPIESSIQKTKIDRTPSTGPTPPFIPPPTSLKPDGIRHPFISPP